MSNILCCRNFPNVDEEDQPRDSLSRLGRGVGRSAASCIRESQLPPHPIFVITDAATDVTGLPAGIEVVRRDCHLSGKARKTEFFNCLPEENSRLR